MPTWGDGRLFLLGTGGSIHIRKYCDIGSEEEGNYVYLTNGTKYKNIWGSCCLPIFLKFLVDVFERSENARPQKHPFKVMEHAIESQEIADGKKINELI